MCTIFCMVIVLISSKYVYCVWTIVMSRNATPTGSYVKGNPLCSTKIQVGEPFWFKCSHHFVFTQSTACVATVMPSSAHFNNPCAPCIFTRWSVTRILTCFGQQGIRRWKKKRSASEIKQSNCVHPRKLTELK